MNIYLFFSLLINLLLITTLIFLYFTPVLDFVVIQKILPRFCNVIEKSNPSDKPVIKGCNSAMQFFVLGGE